jgi:hypothetical protein
MPMVDNSTMDTGLSYKQLSGISIVTRGLGFLGRGAYCLQREPVDKLPL